MYEGVASFRLGKKGKYWMISTPIHVDFDHHIISLLWYVHIILGNLYQATKYNKLLAYTTQNFVCLKNKMMALYYSTQLDKAGQRCIDQWQQRYLSTDKKLAEDVSILFASRLHYQSLALPKLKSHCIMQNTFKQAASLVFISNFLKA